MPGGPGGPSGPSGELMEIIFSAPKAQRLGGTVWRCERTYTDKNLTFGPQWAQATGPPNLFFMLTRAKGPKKIS